VADSARLERIGEVIASMDEDSDGIVKVEHVNKVIEMLGRDNVQMSGKQVKQIIDLIGKEEMLEVENKIEKILGKMPAFEEKDVVGAVKEEAKSRVETVEKDLTETASDNVLEDKAVEMSEDKMEAHMAELFSRPAEEPAEVAPASLEVGQVLSRPAARDNSVKDVTDRVVEEEPEQLEKMKNGSSKPL
jgi:LETM1 and EF-hand domain-containing protein 1